MGQNLRSQIFSRSMHFIYTWLLRTCNAFYDKRHTNFELEIGFSWLWNKKIYDTRAMEKKEESARDRENIRKLGLFFTPRHQNFQDMMWKRKKKLRTYNYSVAIAFEKKKKSPVPNHDLHKGWVLSPICSTFPDFKVRFSGNLVSYSYFASFLLAFKS